MWGAYVAPTAAPKPYAPLPAPSCALVCPSCHIGKTGGEYGRLMGDDDPNADRLSVGDADLCDECNTELLNLRGGT